MSDNRKYYYLKLKENFYNSETMVILESMQDGLLYSNLLLKMYLMSLKSGGILMLNDHLPHTPQTIATFTRHQVGTVERALKVFLEFGLVEILTDGAYYMADIQLLIGQSSTEGERKKKERMRLKRQKLLPSGGADICPPYSRGDICPPEIRDKRLDIRDKSIENRDKENINTFARSSGGQTSQPEADVEALILNDGSEWRPTEALFAEYVRLYPNVDVKQQFNVMRSWCLSNPKKRKTKRGITRFVNSWLTKEQDKGYRRPVDNGSYQQRQSESGYSRNSAGSSKVEQFAARVKEWADNE